MRRRRAFAVREEAALQARPVVLMDDVDGVLPALDLRGVEFAQVQDLALNGASAMHAQTFAHRVVNMLFAVFATDASFEEHAWERYPGFPLGNR